MLTWSDNADNEIGFEIERSTDRQRRAVHARSTTVAGERLGLRRRGGRARSTEYCYRVRAYNGAGASDYSNVACATTPAEPNSALDFARRPRDLRRRRPSWRWPQFTLECWFRRDGTGTTTSTGTGGVSAIPLVTKGCARATAAPWT